MVRQACGSLSRRRWSKVNDVAADLRSGRDVSAWSEAWRSLLMITACCYRGAITIIGRARAAVSPREGDQAVAVRCLQGFPMFGRPCLTPAELAAFHLGDLPEADLEELGEHLETCPRCEEAVRSLDGLSD